MKIIIKDKQDPVRIRQKVNVKKVSHEEVSEALGVSSVAELAIEHQDPLTMAKLFLLAVSNVKSTGGRPGRIGDIERKKIPLTKNEWNALERVTQTLHSIDVPISTGQVASLIIANTINEIIPLLDEIDREVQKEGQMAAHGNEASSDLGPLIDVLKRKIILKRISKFIPGVKQDVK